MSTQVRTAPYTLGPTAEEMFKRIGLDVDPLQAGRRPLIRACMDWSEQCHHLAGALGAEIMTRMIRLGWIARRSGRRDLPRPRTRIDHKLARWITSPRQHAELGTP